LDVALIEARHRIGEGAICSGVIGEEAFERFALPTQPVTANIRWIQAISPRGKILDHRSEGLLARVVSKSEFNQALGDRAIAAGTEILLSQHVESLEREKHGITLRVRSAGNRIGTLKSRVAVIASGVNCSLNRVLGLARPAQWLRAMQGEITIPIGDPLAPTKVYVGRSVAPGAFGWVIPLGQDRARVGVMTVGDPKLYFESLLRRIAAKADEGCINARQKAVAQMPVGRCAADRILLIGEAAGHVKTTTGGGIYYGLLSAEYAAEVILRAFEKRDLTSFVLSDFERYWRTGFGSELLVGYFARALASRFSDSNIEGLFDLVNSTGILGRLNGNLRFDWHRKALLVTLRALLAVPGGIGKGWLSR
jgi:flavin-dependent dehydrogenase